ncbi:MAG: NmrA/HSCARG family protein [Lysobacterales bacterium]|nr:MAG: NmrA/HSCARG family protein [Xanthomonadales bacterium]
MSEAKVIAIVGATGAQGGGLARAILDQPHGGFRARAITRNAASDPARALAARGAEVVAADLDDAASLRAAFAGAYGAYCVTNFWEHFSPEKELSQARNLAEAAAAAGLKHVIWSTLEDTRRWVPLDDERLPTLMHQYKVPHFDAKGGADHFFTEAGLPVTFLLTSFYWDNLIYFGSGPKRAPDGMLHLTLPMGDAKLPGIAAEDIGRCALSIFRQPQRYIGKTVGIAGEHLTGGEMAAALSLALGEAVLYNDLSPDDYRDLGFPGAADLGNMFQFKRDFNEYFCGVRDIASSRELNPELQTFEQWLARHANEIPLE